VTILHLVLFGLLIFLGSVFATIAGGGLGIIVIILLTFVTDIRSSVVVMALVGFLIQPAKVLHFRQWTVWRITGWYVLTGIPASFAGGLFLYSLPVRVIEILLALLCLLFVGFRAWKPSFRLCPLRGLLLGMGAINGIQGGAVGEAALLRSPFLLSLGLTKEQFIGTSSMIALGMNVSRVAAYVPNIRWDTMTLAVLGVSLLPIFAGVATGKRFLRSVSPKMFERMLLCVIVLGACKLLLVPS